MEAVRAADGRWEATLDAADGDAYWLVVDDGPPLVDPHAWDVALTADGPRSVFRASYIAPDFHSVLALGAAIAALLTVVCLLLAPMLGGYLIAKHGEAIICNTPGSPKGCVEQLSAILDVLPHALRLLADQPAPH